MKRIPSLLLMLLLIGVVTSCGLTKTVTTRDSVKSVQTTTADFYDFVIEGRRGTLKDASYFIAPLLSKNPDMVVKIIKGLEKDEGYWIPAPAKSGTATTIDPESDTIEELEIRIGELTPSVFPQRGN
jgi:hypothetical protein